MGDSVSMKTVPEFAWASIHTLFGSGSLEGIPYLVISLHFSYGSTPLSVGDMLK